MGRHRGLEPVLGSNDGAALLVGLSDGCKLGRVETDSKSISVILGADEIDGRME